jgi:hypothetical protein
LWESRSPPTLILSPQETEGFFCAPKPDYFSANHPFGRVERKQHHYSSPHRSIQKSS